MLLTKSPTYFVVYWKITYKVYILLLYHLFCYSSACHVVAPLTILYSMLYMTHDTAMINVHNMAINIFIFISQGILLSSTGIIDLCACSHALNCGHNSPSMWYHVLVIMPRYGRRHRVRCDFMETQARATTVPDVPHRTQYRCVYLLMHCVRK